MQQIVKKIQNHFFKAKLISLLKSFELGNTKYKYLVHKYNSTWRNERAVEIPIIQKELAVFAEGNILEVGNVLAHYMHISHTVVDKYEQSNTVINQDIVEYEPTGKFDLIISISTLEHVGFDEEIKDPDKIFRAVEKMKSWLKPNGKLLITVPLGYNPHLDKTIASKQLLFTTFRYLKRMSNGLDWVEVEESILKQGVLYNAPFPNANVVVIAEFVSK